MLFPIKAAKNFVSLIDWTICRHVTIVELVSKYRRLRIVIVFLTKKSDMSEDLKHYLDEHVNRQPLPLHKFDLPFD